MRPLDFDGIDRALVVTAHPDDVDFGFAGTVCVMTDLGIEVTYCIVTDGDAGGAESGIERSEMAALRRDEQTKAAAAVGVQQLHFLGFPDGAVQPSIELRCAISRVIRQVRPQRVLAQSPERNWDRIYASHPDHLAAGEAAVCAVYPDARNRWAHPELDAEGLEPWTVDEVWIGAGSADVAHYVDITATIDRKLEALLCHKSQISDPAAIDTMVRGWTSGLAIAAGLPGDHYAEAVRVVNTR